jgi:hypothetical protein
VRKVPPPATAFITPANNPATAKSTVLLGEIVTATSRYPTGGCERQALLKIQETKDVRNGSAFIN